MSESGNISTICNTLSVIDLVLFAGGFYYLHSKINNLEKTSGSKITQAGREVSSDFHERLKILEEEREILLKRLGSYDEIFLQIMNRFKDINPILESNALMVSSLAKADNTKNKISKKKLSSKNSSKESILSRRDPYIDMSSEDESLFSEKSIEISESEEDEDNIMSSYLRE